MAEQMWGGRFAKSTDEMINEFQASINFDKRMYHEDIAGSIAHATMLCKVGILTEEDKNNIISGLKNILAKIEQGDFNFSVDLEDIHMNIEKRLTEAIGEAGGRLHTARSRNDQVALDYCEPHTCDLNHELGTLRLVQQLAALCILIPFDPRILAMVETSQSSFDNLERLSLLANAYNLTRLN